MSPYQESDPTPKGSGSNLATRVEAMSRTTPPPPKGKGLVLLLLGAVVLFAMIQSLVGEGPAEKAVREAHENDPANKVPDGFKPGEVNPLPAPDGGVGGGTGPLSGSTAASAALPDPGEEPRYPEGLPVDISRRLRINITALRGRNPREVAQVYAALRDLPAVVDAAPEEIRESLRALVFAQIVPMAKSGLFRREVLEAASWLAIGAGDTSSGSIVTLILVARGEGLQDNWSAAAAIDFLSTFPDRGGPVVLTALDQVITDPIRPLHIRVAAATTRLAAGRPQQIKELAESPATHPRLRAALQQK